MTFIGNAILNVIPYLGATVFAYVILRGVQWLIAGTGRRRCNRQHEILMCILVCYFTILFSVTLNPVNGIQLLPDSSKINIIPFHSLYYLMQAGEDLDTAFLQSGILKSLLVLVPAGLFFPFLWKRYRKVSKILSMGFFLSFFMEIGKLFLGKETDIDTIFFQTLGALLGYFCYRVICVCITDSSRTFLMKVYKKDSRYVKNLRCRETGMLISICFFMVMAVGFYIRVQVDGNSFLTENSMADVNQENRIVENLSAWEPGSVTKAEKVFEDSEKLKVSPDICKTLDIEGNCAILLQADTREILYQKDEKERVAPASTAKLLTALTVINQANLTDEVTIGEELSMVPADASVAGFNEGDRVTIRQLLEGLLLPSGNDAAYALANYVGSVQGTGDVERIQENIASFVTLMNRQAEQLGLENTCIKNPDGYDEEGQYISAQDLAVIAMECLKKDTLQQIVGAYRISETLLNGREVTWYNTNELLNPESMYYMEDAVGMKTGSTEGAGKCLVAAARKNGNTYITVILHTSEEGRYQDTERMLSMVQ